VPVRSAARCWWRWASGPGKKEIIDFHLAGSESAAEWEAFLSGLFRRGLTGEGVEMIGVDGGKGLLAALPTVYPGLAVQRCWAHKIRNVLNKVRKADQPAVKRDLHGVMNAPDLPRARTAARRFADRWQGDYPKAVACLRNDLDELLTCWATPLSPSAGGCARPMPSNAASAKSDAAPGPWASSPTAPAWIASCSPSLLMKTATRASAPLSC